MSLLEVRGLRIALPQRDGTETEVVHGIDFSVDTGEIVGLVGESGSGKTQTALAIADLSAKGTLRRGEILFRDTDLLRLPGDVMRTYRGSEIAMIFQEPMTCLNPTMRIGRQVEENLIVHRKLSRTERRAIALDALAAVELPDPADLYRRYPHELSGGQRQRVMIASAMVCSPQLLIADEPTTALDVTIQAEILKLLQKLSRERGMAVLLISHDLRVIRKICARVAVMSDGRIVERGDVDRIFRAPADPYTRRLIESIPRRGT